MKKLTAIAVLALILLPLFSLQAHACGGGSKGGHGDSHAEESSE